MTTTQFAMAIQKGMGRAAVAINGPVSKEFEKIILNACSKDQRHDPQLEDNRASYLMNLVDRAGLSEKVQSLVLAPIDESLDDWDRLQRIRMIGQFARRSNLQALGILRDLALNNGTDSWQVLAGAGDIEWLVQHILPVMPLDEKWRVGSWLDEKPDLPDETSRALVAAVEELELIREKNQTVRQSRNQATFDEVLHEIQSGKNYIDGLISLAPNLSNDQLLQVANLWINERDYRKGRNFLRLIERHRFPLPIQCIVDLVNLGDFPINFEDVLANCQDPLCRELGLRLISQPQPDFRGYKCLGSSFDDKDLSVMVRQLERFLSESDEVIHGLGMDLRNIAEKMSLKARLPFLLWSYEHTPCSACRGFAADMMFDDGSLPVAYRQEMLFDADSLARELAAKPT